MDKAELKLDRVSLKAIKDLTRAVERLTYALRGPTVTPGVGVDGVVRLTETPGKLEE